VDDAMYTLLASISGGQDWVDIVAPFRKHSPWQHVSFCFYIVFVTVGMLNVLTGVFVSRAAEITVLDKDLIIQSEIASKKSLVKQLRDMFGEIDRTNCGTIDIDHLTRYMARADVQAYLSSQQLHSGNFKRLISLLDPQKTGKVTRDAFIAGCLQYKGNARTLDVALVLREQQRQIRILATVVHNLKEQAKVTSQDAKISVDGIAEKNASNQMGTSVTQSFLSCGSAVGTDRKCGQSRR